MYVSKTVRLLELPTFGNTPRLARRRRRREVGGYDRRGNRDDEQLYRISAPRERRQVSFDRSAPREASRPRRNGGGMPTSWFSRSLLVRSCILHVNDVKQTTHVPVAADFETIFPTLKKIKPGFDSENNEKKHKHSRR